jgi:hypothetical protein
VPSQIFDVAFLVPKTLGFTADDWLSGRFAHPGSLEPRRSLSLSPSDFHRYWQRDVDPLEKELRTENAASRKKGRRVEKLEGQLGEVEAGQSERQNFSDHIHPMKLSLWRKEKHIETLGASDERAADLGNQVERPDETRRQMRQLLPNSVNNFQRYVLKSAHPMNRGYNMPLSSDACDMLRYAAQGKPWTLMVLELK